MSALALIACASKPPPPTVVQVTLEAKPSVNPDSTGRPSPVVVRVYELKSVALFESSDFFALFEKDRETLGGEMVRADEFNLSPGDRRSFERVLDPATRYIAVVAGFRDLERARWRASLPVPMHRKSPASIIFDASTVTIRGP